MQQQQTDDHIFTIFTMKWINYHFAHSMCEAIKQLIDLAKIN